MQETDEAAITPSGHVSPLSLIPKPEESLIEEEIGKHMGHLSLLVKSWNSAASARPDP